MPFALQRPDGSVQPIVGCQPSKRDGAKAYTPPAKGKGTSKVLPKAIDLRPHLPPPAANAHINGPVADAVATAYGYLRRRGGAPKFVPSAAFVYYTARARDGMEDEDEGTSLRQALEAVCEHGSCSLSSWPTDVDSVFEKPDDEAYAEAAEVLPAGMATLPADPELWKRCLAEGYPIAFAIEIYPSFELQRRPGLIPKPHGEERSGAHGTHVLLAVGYGRQHLVVRNAWGPEWGDEGYGYLPFDYITDKKLFAGDAWMLRGKTAVPAPKTAEEPFSDDDECELAGLHDKDYAELLEALGEIPLETRLGQLFLIAGDIGRVTDAGLDDVASAFEHVLTRLGSSYAPEAVLRHAFEHVEDEDLLEETTTIVGDHLSEGFHRTIVVALAHAAGVEDISAEDEGLIYELVETWLDGAAPALDGALVDGLPYQEVDDYDEDDDDEPEDDGFHEEDELDFS